MRRILFSRWTQSLVGTALLGGLVWEFGVLLPPLEPWLPRLLVIQSMLVVWAVANALLDARRRARGEALIGGLTATASAEEAAAVGATLTNALALLRKAGRGGALTELPLYVIIGPPGAGKTTALLNAGLNFTLAEQLGRSAVSGVGGTRHCEWWFTDRAVLVDTAGRYTTQDSDAVTDQAGWDAFLSLLGRTRPRQPLNGVLVAFPLPELAQATAKEIQAHAASISRRIAELQGRLGVRIPVYALFTKADLIAGFSEFFEPLDHDGREQVWGETYPISARAPAAAAPAPGDRFVAGFRELAGRLTAALLPRLLSEHRADRVGPIAGFPTQFASLEKPLAGFIAAAFPAQSSLLRGVYFASGTQEGTPIDRLTGAMARAFGIDQARAAALRPDTGRSYFLGRLLRDVIFNEAMLVREAPGAARLRLLLRAAAFTLLLLAVGGTAAAMLTSYRAAGSDVAAMAAALHSYEVQAAAATEDPVTDGDLRALTALLDKARSLLDAVSPAPVGFGMEQAGKLAAAAAQVYGDGLIYGLLPRLVWRLETQMRGNLARPDRLYELTRVYLMLGGAGPLDAALVRSWVEQDLPLAFPAADDAAARADLLRHLDRLLAEPLPPITLDTALVAAARASFSRVPLADRVYSTIRASAAAAALPQWRPFDPLGLAGTQLFARASGQPMTDGIAGLFTATGFSTVLVPSLASASKRVAAEGWVDGRQTGFAPAELRQLEAAVNARYAADFTAQWDALLGDLNIDPSTTIPQAAQALYILASPESPLRALLRSVAAQLRLQPSEPAPGPLLQALRHFQPLIDLGAGDNPNIERQLRLVADIQQQLAKIAALPLGTPLPPGGDDIGAALTVNAAGQPQPLSRWLLGLAANAQALRTGNARRQLVISYGAPGGPLQACQAAVARHYPFVADGPSLPLADFARVFGPGGALDGFLNTQLKPFLDLNAKPWSPQATGPLTPADAAQFQRAHAIRDAFFAAGQAAPSVSFEVTPAAPSAARAVTLDLSGTVVAVGKGPPHTAEVTWPAPDPAAPATLSADPSTPPLPLADDGPWAMFRLFARGRLKPAPKPGRQLLSFAAGATPIVFELRPSGLGSPFTPGLLADFRCPTVQ